MNEYLEAVILGALQGLTEFLPVSSSGHLALAKYLGIGENGYFFNIMLHVATLFAVCFSFRKTLWNYLRHPLQKEVFCLLIASIPTAFAAFFIRYYIGNAEKALPFGFLLTTVFLLSAQFCRKKNGELGYRNALIIGVSQGLACFSGLSRSGATISTALLLGTDKEKAGEFSFLLSIPIIIGSALFEGMSGGGEKTATLPLLLGMVTAFLSGTVAVNGFLRIIKKGVFLPFAIYTFLLAVLSAILIYGPWVR